MSTRWPDPLPCGHALDELVAQVADDVPGDTAHQRDCAHCQQALTVLTDLWEVVGDLAAEQVTAPERIDRAVVRRIRRDLFVVEVARVFGGILPRLSRAFAVYTGLAGGATR